MDKQAEPTYYFFIMASGRVPRGIDILLDEAGEALAQRNQESVRRCAAAGLAVFHKIRVNSTNRNQAS